ncbi:MAG: precorrin-6A/cobalt-precorrin-6A reductase, partial [Thalassovita sp.]|nr:precorrin-6A/cobalt-precorrin-6A reductase [Thalassovita sp.]
AQLSDCELILRVVDPQPEPFPLPNGRYLVARPPFTLASEKALFAELDIDFVVAKNSGAKGSYTKILASREMDITVLIIDRPEQPGAPRVATVGDALMWVEQL